MATDRSLKNPDSRALSQRMNAVLEDEDTSRTVLLAGGGALAVFGLTRLTPLGLVLSLVGGGLVYLGAQHKSLAAYGRELAKLASRAGSEVDVDKTIIIDRPIEEVYKYWRDFHNLAQFMNHIDSVDVKSESESIWRARLFRAGPLVEWHAQTIEDIPNQRISWRSLPDSDVETFGSVRFESVHRGEGTEVRLLMEYRPPGGAVTKMFNPALSQAIQDDLRRFKDIVESRGAPAKVPGGTARYEYE